MFCHNFFLGAFTNTTGPDSGDVNEIINSVVQAHELRIEVTFSQPLPRETSMVIMSMYSTALEIDSSKRVKRSYINNAN